MQVRILIGSRLFGKKKSELESVLSDLLRQKASSDSEEAGCPKQT